MALYQESGYLDIKNVYSYGMPFTFITGARGTGKTYGILCDAIETETPFILMRRTRSELDFLGRDETTNPFAQLNKDRGWNIGLEKSGEYLYRIVEREEDSAGKLKTIRVIGVALSLSTVANIRGFDGSRYDLLFYDEFIPELHARAIRDEHYAFLNAIETIGRNRELLGLPPLRVVCASNSNRLDNAIYMGLNLVRRVSTMKRKRQTVCVLEKRGICLINLEDSPISKKKRDTALYRMSAGTGFADMALDNKYIGEKELNPLIRRCNLSEYRPLVVIGEICIYEHKTRNEWYVCKKTSGTPPVYDMTQTDCTRFRRAYGYIWLRYLDGEVYFDCRMSELLLTKVF